MSPYREIQCIHSNRPLRCVYDVNVKKVPEVENNYPRNESNDHWYIGWIGGAMLFGFVVLTVIEIGK